MSYLIEDYQFQECVSLFNLHNSSQNSPINQNFSYHNPQLKSISKDEKINIFNQSKHQISLNDALIHKYGPLSLLFYRKITKNKQYHFQGIVLDKNQKFTIRFKQKRILFGKQWMKKTKQSRVNVQIHFYNGQIKLCWSQFFNIHKESVLNPKIKQKKLFEAVFCEMRNFFQKEFLPICQKILFSQTRISQSEQKFEQRFKELRKCEVNCQRLQKFLYMSNTFDTFQRDKETYKKLQQKITKQKESIVNLQSNIDMSFMKIGSEINLYVSNSILNVRKKLVHLSSLQNQESISIQSYIKKQSAKYAHENQSQYIFNCIGILKVQNKKRFISSGGTCSVYMAKMIFQYIFSDDSKFWIEQNKRNTQNALQKSFVIKEPKIGYQNKLKHENLIVRQMKGGYCDYLSKYYRVQNVEKDAPSIKTQDLIIMDFLKGETLDKFQRIHRQSLSFWTKIFLLRSITNGLRFISSYKIVHLDLKPSNIIVIGELHTKIIDFSESYHYQICNKDYKPGLSLPYSAPEILQEKEINYDQKCDIFSLGVIMFELFINAKIMDLSKDELLKVYEKKEYLKRIFLCPQCILDENLSPIINVMIILIMKCLDPRPQFRPTLTWISIILNQILQYFKGN